MQFEDEGIVVSVRPHGETAAIAEVFTRAHGRHLGFVHGGRSRKLRPVLQIGNHVDVTWRARLAENMGHFAVELRRGYAAESFENPIALNGLSSMAELSRLLPERDAHANLFEVMLFVLNFLDDQEAWPSLYVRFELALLEELGVGLDLARCAATGQSDDLVYVSPKSGRAVSRAAGAPYADRLFAIPPFLRRGDNRKTDPCDIADAMDMTGHFFSRRVFAELGGDLPDVRKRLLAGFRAVR